MRPLLDVFLAAAHALFAFHHGDRADCEWGCACTDWARDATRASDWLLAAVELYSSRGHPHVSMSQHTRLAKKKRVSSLFRRFIKEHGSQSICSLQVQSGLLSRFISNEFARLFRLHNINQDGVHDRKKDRKTVMGDSISNSQVFQFSEQTWDLLMVVELL